jgi:hypothetical protein
MSKETRFIVAGEDGERVDITELLHPSGHCLCNGKGTCSWCELHCARCGAPAELHPITQATIDEVLGPNSGEEPHEFDPMVRVTNKEN